MKEYLKKRLNIREKRLRYDFLPSMLEIIERPANKAAGFIIWMIVLTFASVLVWAYFYKLDIVVTANGVMVPENNLVLVQSENGGRVSEVYVEDTQTVKKGDPVFVINQTSNEMDIDKLKYDLEVLKVQQEIYGKLYEQFDAEEPEEIDSSRYGDYRNIAESMLVEEALYRTQIKGYELQKTRVEKSDDKKLVDNELESFRIQRKLTLLQNINSLQIKVHEKEAELEEAEYRSAAKIVRAPADGTVTQMQVKTPETLVSAGQTLAYLIPENCTMIFRAYVASAEIEHIKEGDQVSVRLAAFDDSDFEIVKGTICRISDVSVSVEGQGNVYQVEIRLDETEDMTEISCRIGLEGTCDIIVGERSVLDYFLEPFKKGFRESLKES